MKLRFKAAGYLEEYHGNGLAFKDEQEAEVSLEVAQRLLTDFPENFTEVAEVAERTGPSEENKAPEKPPGNKMFTGGKKK